jgi:hypothetical protein
MKIKIQLFGLDQKHRVLVFPNTNRKNFFSSTYGNNTVEICLLKAARYARTYIGEIAIWTPNEYEI